MKCEIRTIFTTVTYDDAGELLHQRFAFKRAHFERQIKKGKIKTKQNKENCLNVAKFLVQSLQFSD